MTPREAIIATMKREPADRVPGWILFSTPQAEQLLVPDCTLPTIVEYDLEYAEYLIKVAKATDSSMVQLTGSGIGGHVVEQTETSYIVELDNGCRRLTVTHPEWFYETLSRPLDGSTNADDMHLPDMEYYQPHWDYLAKAVQRVKDEGLFAVGAFSGFYAGIWEHCRKIEEFLVDLMEGSDFAQALVDKWGIFHCEIARKIMECGADAIFWADDLGSNTGPLISPRLYRKYFFPWHKRATEIAHEFGKLAIMHSHGNINQLLPDIAETGLDVLHPVGPSEGMNLGQLKEDYGDRLGFAGGISRFIADMSQDELRVHLEEVYRVGSNGGAFIPTEEGGVPRDMTPENYKAYAQMRYEFSRKYAWRG